MIAQPNARRWKPADRSICEQFRQSSDRRSRGPSKKSLRLCIFRGLPFVLFGNAAGFAAQFEPRNKEDLSVGLSYRWVIVGAGALMTCVGIGAMFSLAVYLQPMSVDTGWSRAGISSAMTIDFLTMGIAGFGWGAASDRIGTQPGRIERRRVARVRPVSRQPVDIADRITSSPTASWLAWPLGAFFAPMIAAATRWFDNNRSLAVSLVSAGMGIAPMTISPTARWLISTYDWRTGNDDGLASSRGCC